MISNEVRQKNNWYVYIIECSNEMKNMMAQMANLSNADKRPEKSNY